MATDENKPKPEMTKWPECNVPVRVDRIEKHLTKVHRVKELLPKHRKNLIKPPAAPKSFIVDEFGVLQSYDMWWKNQNLAENFSSTRPAQSGETSKEFNRPLAKVRISHEVQGCRLRQSG